MGQSHEEWTPVRYGRRKFRPRTILETGWRWGTGGMDRAFPVPPRRMPVQTFKPNQPVPPSGTPSPRRPFDRTGHGTPTDPKFAEGVRRFHKIIQVLHHLWNVDPKHGRPVPNMIVRMEDTLAEMVKPAIPTEEVVDKIIGNAKNWGHATMMILKDHYEDVLYGMLGDLPRFLSPDWRTMFATACRWARRNFARISQDVLDYAEALIMSYEEAEKEKEEEKRSKDQEKKKAGFQTKEQDGEQEEENQGRDREKDGDREQRKDNWFQVTPKKKDKESKVDKRPKMNSQIKEKEKETGQRKDKEVQTKEENQDTERKLDIQTKRLGKDKQPKMDREKEEDKGQKIEKQTQIWKEKDKEVSTLRQKDLEKQTTQQLDGEQKDTKDDIVGMDIDRRKEKKNRQSRTPEEIHKEQKQTTPDSEEEWEDITVKIVGMDTEIKKKKKNKEEKDRQSKMDLQMKERTQEEEFLLWKEQMEKWEKKDKR